MSQVLYDKSCVPGKLLVKTHQAQLKGGYIVPLSDGFWKRLRNMTEINIQEL